MKLQADSTNKIPHDHCDYFEFALIVAPQYVDLKCPRPLGPLNPLKLELPAYL